MVGKNETRSRRLPGSSIRVAVACAILCLAAPAAAGSDSDRIAWFNQLFGDIRRAQDTNRYYEYLRDNPVARKTIEAAISAELAAIKKGSSGTRNAAFDTFMRYWSAKKNGFQTGALRFYDRVGITEKEIRKGNFEPKEIAGRLVDAVQIYLHKVLAPVLAQVEGELRRDLGDKNLVFLGRDFTSAYLWARASGHLSKEQLFLINASRAVKDKINFSGKRSDGRRMLGQLGFDTAAAKRGTAFLDSSMSGKIPAALLKAMVDKLKPEEIYQVLTRAEIRYVHTKRISGKTLPQLAKGSAGGDKKLTREAAMKVLDRVYNIPTFDLVMPPDPDGREGKEGIAKYEQRRKHKLFEWLPKALTTARDFSSGGKGLQYNVPNTPELRLRSLLGLYADLELLETNRTRSYTVPKKTHRRPSAQRVVAVSVVDTKVPDHKASDDKARDPKARDHKALTLEQVTGSQPQSEFEAIDRAAKTGVSGLLGWLQRPSGGVEARYSKMRVVSTGDKGVPYYLEVDGKRIFDMTGVVGYGKSVTVYLTTRNTVLKVPSGVTVAGKARRQSVPKKQLLDAWAGPIVAAAGIDVAKNLQWDKDGLWLEQEFISGKSLDHFVASDGTLNLPGSVKRQVTGLWKKAAALAKKQHVYLDFKAPNMVLTNDGRLVNVDYVPLTKNRYYRYFHHVTGKAISTKEFFRRFAKPTYVPSGVHQAHRPDSAEGSATRSPQGKRRGLIVGKLRSLVQ